MQGSLHINNDNLKPMCFISRSLTKGEYDSALEKEALEILFFVTKLNQYLSVYHFILRTDITYISH